MTETSNKKGAEKEQAPTIAQEFFFSGGTEYEPVTITAASFEEAMDEWKKVRKPTHPSQSTQAVDLQAKEVVE